MCFRGALDVHPCSSSRGHSNHISRALCSPGNGPIIIFLSAIPWPVIDPNVWHIYLLAHLILASPYQVRALSHLVITLMAFRGWSRMNGEVALALFFLVHSPHPSFHLLVDTTWRAMQWTSLTFQWTPDKGDAVVNISDFLISWLQGNSVMFLDL